MSNTYVFHAGFLKVGGIEGLWEKFPNAVGSPYLPALFNNTTVATITPTNISNQSHLSSCYQVTPYWGNMLRPLDDPDYPWLGVWTTLPIMGIWYWCTDQVCLILLMKMIRALIIVEQSTEK